MATGLLSCSDKHFGLAESLSDCPHSTPLRVPLTHGVQYDDA